MKPKNSIFPFLSFLLVLPLFAHASIQITNVMYDLPGADEGREWIEITNTGASAVDVSDYKFLEGGVKHKLVIVQGGAELAPGAKATIASNPVQFLSEHSGFAGALIKSSFSLSNTGETLTILNAEGGVEHSLTYAAPKKEPAPKESSTKSAISQKVEEAASPATQEVTSDEGRVSGHSPKENLPLFSYILGLIATIVLGVVAVTFVRTKEPQEATKSLADEFEITEL